jgi:hypothetical protein
MQKEFDVVVTSYDWGGYTQVKVRATVAEPGQEAKLDAHLKGRPEVGLITIPLDENNNHIGDAWKKKHLVYGKPADWDGLDLPAGHKYPGDGISLYEKYRGVDTLNILDDWPRLDPWRKYLFIYDPNNLLLQYGALTGLENAAGVRVAVILKNQWAGPGSFFEDKRVVNFNHGYKDAVEQHALHLTSSNGLLEEYPDGYREIMRKLGQPLVPIGKAPLGHTWHDGAVCFGSPRHTC